MSFTSWLGRSHGAEARGVTGASGIPKTATAILDRFLHDAVLIPTNGRSYRLKDAPSAQEQDAKTACKAERDPCNDAHITQHLRPDPLPETELQNWVQEG